MKLSRGALIIVSLVVVWLATACGTRVEYVEVPVTVTPGDAGVAAPDAATGDSTEPVSVAEPPVQSAGGAVETSAVDTLDAVGGTLSSNVLAGETSRIAFMGPLGQSGQIQAYVVNPDGTGLRMVSESMGEGYFPSLSPDGRRLAFMSNTAVDPDIFVVDLESDQVTNLTDRPGFDNQPVFSPDGKQIAFVSDREGGDTDLWLMNADGSEPRRLARTPGEDHLGSWSPDGTRLVYSNQDELGESIWIMDVATGSYERLSENEDVVESAPVWSPAGDLIAYYAVPTGGAPQVYVINVDGSERRQITTRPNVAAMLPAWSPDGRQLIYTERPSQDRFDLIVYDMESERGITMPNVQGFATAWTRTDEFLADTGFTQGPKDSGVEVSAEVLEVAYRKGSPDAPVTIVEFSDYQCPFCQRWFSDTLPQLQPYIDDGTVQLIFVDFPLSIHPNAPMAAAVARCAGELGGSDAYWELHDSLFNTLPTWNSLSAPRDYFAQLAADSGLDREAIGSCVDSGRYDAHVQAGLREGLRLGVSGTPTFFVNGERLVGAQPFEAFAAFLP